MRLNRRGLLGFLGVGAVAGASTASAQSQPVQFLHGVASGDPDALSAVFWTRVTPGGLESADIPVVLEIARDKAFERMAHRATGLVASSARDFTVKHDLNGRGLEPGTEYHYRFVAGSVTSPVGRVRTLPAGATADVVLAVASCQLHPGGLFNAYDAMASLDRLDAVIHLGDYIYEYGAEPDDYGMGNGAMLSRLPQPPHEIVSLDDYRLRHAQYKSDPDLQAAHARAAFICVWDDHEIANDAWTAGAQNHQADSEGDYATRKAAALRAYFEWMPIRETGAPMREAIQRSFQFGDLASLIMVETRLQGRSQQLTYARDLTFKPGPDGQPVPDLEAFRTRMSEPGRDLLDDAQRDWIGRELSASKRAGQPWQILGNQVVMARVAGPNVAAMAPPEQVAALLASLPPAIRTEVERSTQLFKLGAAFNLDSWDGYPAARERLYQTFAEAGVQPVVLAGDSHSFWVNALDDASGQRRAVEFGTTSISSPSPGDAIPQFPLGQALAATNPEVLFCDQRSKGFTLLTLTPDAAKAELIAVSTITAKPYQVSVVGTWTARRDAGGVLNVHSD